MVINNSKIINQDTLNTNRSSRTDGFCKKAVLRNFKKCTGKHLCQSLFLNKATSLRLWHRCFPVNFVKFLRTPFLKEHLWWLLLYKPLTSSDNASTLNSACSGRLLTVKYITLVPIFMPKDRK